MRRQAGDETAIVTPSYFLGDEPAAMMEIEGPLQRVRLFFADTQMDLSEHKRRHLQRLYQEAGEPKYRVSLEEIAQQLPTDYSGRNHILDYCVILFTNHVRALFMN